MLDNQIRLFYPETRVVLCLFTNAFRPFVKSVRGHVEPVPGLDAIQFVVVTDERSPITEHLPKSSLMPFKSGMTI
jgi:hypothetical protein